jgi:exosortase A
MEAAADRTWQPERSVGWIVALLVFVLMVFWQTTGSMVNLWRSSGTYSHGFLILPAFVWLVWQRRLTLSSLPVQPFWPGLFALTGLGCLWLMGHLASFNAPTQFALVAMVPAVVATVLGVAWVRALAFPLMFLFFAVPVGDSLVPYMMDWTADFTVASLRLSGVPVYREGNYLSIPSGDWSVVEACSGIRYVFACFTVATLYAWTTYRATARRLLFVVAALAIAVVANWVRAYVIVMVGHLSDNRVATGIDHFVYGGVFFGVVMALVFSLGAFWREHLPGKSMPGASGLTTKQSIGTSATASASKGSLAAALATAATLLVWPLVSLGTSGESHRVSSRIGDIEPRAGWVRNDEPAAKWQPQLSGPLQVRVQTFTREGRQVSVYLGVFDRPTPDSKLTAAENQLVGSQDTNWRLIQRGVAEANRRGEVISVRTGALVGRQGRIVAWHWYWVDGTLTTNPARAALLQMLARLHGRSERSAWVTAFTTDGEGAASAPLVLNAFLADMLESIDQALRVADS